MASSVRKASGLDRIIGNRVRARRLELHLSQADLADVLGVTFQQVQKYEKGRNRIGAGRLAIIAQALKTDSSFFMGDMSEGKKPVLSKFAVFMATKDGAEILEAMIRLDQPHRRAVVSLARMLATAHEAMK
jgi:transcriptional regulator with XRE-family HTH domain